MSFVSEPEMFGGTVEDIVLREYQHESIDGLRENIRKGVQSQILASMVGSGKTVMSAFLLHECWTKGKTGCFVVDRLSLLGQTSMVLDRYGIPHGVIQADHPRRKPGEQIQVASIQTVKHRGWPKADLLIVDECFTGDTIISTPQGGKKIESMAVGHIVQNACGEGVIRAIMRHESRSIIEIKFTDGSKVRATRNHPFFTSEGWKEAAKLDIGEGVFSEKEVRALWCGVSASDNGKWIPHEGRGLYEAAFLRAILREESEQSFTSRSLQGKNIGIFEANRTPPFFEEGKRNWSDESRSDDEIVPAEGMGHRWSYCNEIAMQWIPNELQDRHLESGIKDSCGVGWIQPLRSFEKRAGREEGRMASQKRVESITHIECRGGVPVFNLEVSGHPSYFAGGALVHNCHVVHKTILNKIARKDAITIGLTATPFTKGLGKHYSAIVNVTTGNKLTADGFLVPFKVWAANEPDMTGAKVVAGEWTDDECSKRAMKIVGDVVEEYKKHGDERKAIIFGVDVAHCEEMQRQFLAGGINVGLYTYKTGDEEREFMLQEFRKPDSKVRALISVAALSRGFDVPDVGTIIMCRPLRSSFSEFVQILGRGLRSYPSKKDCIILDMAGNFMRHYPRLHEFMEDGVNELDDGKVKPKAPPVKPERVPVKCPKCSHVFGGGDHCPECGYIFLRKSKVEHEQGNLGMFNGEKVLAYDREAKRQLFAELSWIRLERRYARGWVSHKYRAVTGVWPTNMADVEPRHPTRATWEILDRVHEKRMARPVELRWTPADLFT